MSKPSEKAMQLARKFEWSLHGVETLAACIEQYATAEIEAQHRKTWALAMDKLKDYLETERMGAGAYGFEEESERLGKMWDEVAALPCPPIEATKDK